MNKAQLVDAMAAESGMSKVAARKVLDAFLKVSTRSLRRGEKVTLVGFGTFTRVAKPSRLGRNPRTGAPIKIIAKETVRFKPGTDLMDHVNRK